MKVQYDSRDDLKFFTLGRPGEHGYPYYKVRCPHCGSFQLLTLESPISAFGDQHSRIVHCNQVWDEEKEGHHIYDGCQKRFVLDVRIDILTTSTAINDDQPITVDDHKPKTKD